MGLRAKLRPLVLKVRAYAWASVAGGVVLWAALLWPFDFAAWFWLLAALLLLILLAPAALVWLTYGGLSAALNLPERLRDAAREAVEKSAEAADAVRGRSAEPDSKDGAGRRAWRLGRTLYGLRGFVLDRREELIGFAALARFANPLALAVLLGSFALSGVVIVCAALAVAVRLLLF
jgi:hypothetical protein